VSSLPVPDSMVSARTASAAAGALGSLVPTSSNETKSCVCWSTCLLFQFMRVGERYLALLFATPCCGRTPTNPVDVWLFSRKSNLRRVNMLVPKLE